MTGGAEVVLRTGLASLQRGGENVGGRLELTDRRLRFRAHRLNLDRRPADIDLTTVEQTVVTWSESTLWPFGRRFPIFPNTVAVHTTRGKREHVFLVWSRDEWKRAIDDAVAALRGAEQN